MSKEMEKEIDDFIKAEELNALAEINSFVDQEDPSFESKYLQPIYNVASPVAKGLSVLGKPLSVAGATGRSIGKYISGQKNAVGPIKEELSTIFPTPEGNPLADLSMLEGANDPLVNVSDEFRYEAPKMASFIEEASSPSSLAQIGSDIALGSTGIRSMGKSGAGKALAKSYKRKVADMYLNAIQKDSSLANALRSSGKWEDVVDFVASDKNLITPFSKQKALDYLEGPTTSTVDEFGIVRTSRDINKGLIGQRGAQAEQALASVRGDKIIDPVEMRFSAYGGLNRSMLDSQKSSAQKIIDDAIPQLDFDQNKIKELMALEDAEALKLLKSSDYPAGGYVDQYKAMIQERGMLPAGFATDLRKQANKLIDDAKLTAVSNPVEAGSLHEAGLALHKAAAQAEMNVVSQYLSPEEINQFMQAKRQQELALASRDLMDKGRLVKGNAGAYVPVGSLDRGLLREGLSMIPEYGGPISSNILDSVVNTAIPGISNVGSAAYPLSQVQPEQKEVYRIPQSVKTDFIVQYEIPRSAQEILAQKDVVMAKIQSEVQDPQVLMMAQQMLDGLQKNPESVKPVLGQLANMMPQIFVKDKYNRFDGIVPMDMRPVAIEDIKQSDVSPAIKAQKINLLHNRGQLLD